MPADLFAAMPAGEKAFKATSDKLTHQEGGKDVAISYKLDPTKTPHEIVMTKTKSDGKTETIYGIYKLEGIRSPYAAPSRTNRRTDRRSSRPRRAAKL